MELLSGSQKPRGHRVGLGVAVRLADLDQFHAAEPLALSDEATPGDRHGASGGWICPQQPKWSLDDHDYGDS